MCLAPALVVVIDYDIVKDIPGPLFFFFFFLPGFFFLLRSGDGKVYLVFPSILPWDLQRTDPSRSFLRNSLRFCPGRNLSRLGVGRYFTTQEETKEESQEYDEKKFSSQMRIQSGTFFGFLEKKRHPVWKTEGG